jgi:DeoR/GlpR family transcriptional regulator of sugar metabolism
MPEQSDARRMRLLEILGESEEPRDLDSLAQDLQCDTRTIRRDLDALQRLLLRVHGLEVRRGRALVARAGYSPGYFTDQLGRNEAAKQAIARAVVRALPDDHAVALTAGSTTYAVAQEIRRHRVEGLPPHNLIVFTNSVPSLLELVAAGVSTGVLGEIYEPEDCAFHTPEYHSAFQPSLAIVGASGVLFSGAGTGAPLDLFSHRAEEAAFLKQMLQSVPEIVIVADHTKLGRRHPWSFGAGVLTGKEIRLVTDALTSEQRDTLDSLTERMRGFGSRFEYEVATISQPTASHPVDSPPMVSQPTNTQRTDTQRMERA